jgi:hypothetical protein
MKRLLSEREAHALTQEALKKVKDEKHELQWDMERHKASAAAFYNQTVALKKQLSKRERALFDLRSMTTVPVETSLIDMKKNQMKEIHLSQKIVHLSEMLTLAKRK